jgi:mono/diheme cytochrome c family protein
MRCRFAPILLLSIFSLSACAADDAIGRPITATDGAELFAMRALGSQAGCVTCHSLTPDHVIVGPSLAEVAVRAGSRVSGLDAEAYLHQAITTPDAYVVDGFESGKMPAVLGEILSEQQIDALVDYLMGAQ